MTVENFYKRFLKENGLYSYAVKVRKKITVNNLRIGIKDNKINNLSYMTGANCNILDLFMDQFQYDKIFSGNSRSAQRRKYYRLNKKWKDSIKGKVVIQHNIQPGDIVIAHSLYGDLFEGIVKSVGKNSTLEVLNIKGGWLTKRKITFFDSFKSKTKKLIVNLYIKNTDGTCYGKIDGTFNEIQL